MPLFCTSSARDGKQNGAEPDKTSRENTFYF
jgi:hypothetical protein